LETKCQKLLQEGVRRVQYGLAPAGSFYMNIVN